jgi:hypothetical protein
MVLDERSRHELYLKLEEVLGPEGATTLMELLPPAGWADVATKRDLDSLQNGLLAELRKEMNDQLRSIHAANLATMLGTATLSATVAFVAARVV